MEHDRFRYDELLARLADAEELVRNLIAVESDGEVSKQSVAFLRLSETGEALRDAQKTLQRLRPESTHERDFRNEKLRESSAEHGLVKQAPPCREEWLFAVLESIQDAVILTDAVGRVIFINHRAQELTGWSLVDAGGKDFDTIFHFVNEVTHANTEQPVSRLLDGGNSSPTRILFVKSDGREIPLEYYGTAIGGPKDRTASLVFVLRDVSQQRLMEQALRNSERLTITGRLAATFAHEIRNPLEAVGNLLYLIAQGTKEEQTRNYVSLASQELERIIHIARHFLTFQRESVHPVPVQIQEIVDNVLALYEKKIRSAGIIIEKEVLFEDSLLAQPGEMRQVIANLIGNAIDAVERNHGQITIRAYSSCHWRSGHSGLRLVIADNGCGITAEIRDKIFEPFFTTKGERGTGLGLWISRGIIKKYEGTIRLRSSIQPSRSGTCFSVFFPL